MKVVFFPRDPNPYQESLATALRRVGVQVDFLPSPTASHTLNILALPIVLLWARLRGAQILHLHWVYPFALPRIGQVPVVRRVARAWFEIVLRTARACGLRVVWTAHNRLPHEQVFDDDAAARSTLLRLSDATITHSDRAVADLREMGWPVPAVVGVVRHGPVEAITSAHGSGASARERLGIPPQARVVGSVGTVERYKGTEEFLRAALEVIAHDPDVWVLVAGRAREEAYAQSVDRLAAEHPRIVTDLRFVPDEELADLIAAIDVVVLAFRRITTSGSAVAALNAGRPLLLPVDAPLDDLPTKAVHRYADLTEGLTWAARIDDDTLASMSREAASWSAEWTWADAAAATATVYRQALSTGSAA